MSAHLVKSGQTSIVCVVLLCKGLVKILMILPFFTIVSVVCLSLLAPCPQWGLLILKWWNFERVCCKGLVKILMFLPLFSRLSAFPPDAHKHLVPPGHHPWCWFVCFCCAVFVSSLFFYSCFCASNFVSDSTRSSFSELILLCFFLVAVYFSENNAQFYVLYAIFCNFSESLANFM